LNEERSDVEERARRCEKKIEKEEEKRRKEEKRRGGDVNGIKRDDIRVYRVTRGQIIDDNTTVAVPLNVHDRMINKRYCVHAATTTGARIDEDFFVMNIDCAALLRDTELYRVFPVRLSASFIVHFFSLSGFSFKLTIVFCVLLN